MRLFHQSYQVSSLFFLHWLPFLQYLSPGESCLGHGYECQCTRDTVAVLLIFKQQLCVNIIILGIEAGNSNRND